MILSSLAHASRYTGLHPLFPRAFDYLRANDPYALAPGRYQLAGDDLIAIVEQVSGKTREQARLECHRKYIDIQLVLDGVDEMGWKTLADCLNPVDEYSEDRDIQFFHDAPSTWIATPPEHFCIFYPDDAHAPLVSKDKVHKVIFKVAVNPGQAR